MAQLVASTIGKTEDHRPAGVKFDVRQYRLCTTEELRVSCLDKELAEIIRPRIPLLTIRAIVRIGGSFRITGGIQGEIENR